MAISFRNSLLVLGLAIAFVPGTASANFKYIPHAPVPVTGPDDSTSVQQGSGVQPTSRSYSIEPQAAAPSVMPPSPSSPMQASPVMAAPPTFQSMPSGGQVISGFGNQVPLVMVLREIVPTSYQFSYGKGVNLGILIDWQGGKPWRDVLNQVLTVQGMVATEKNSVIYIDRRPPNASAMLQ